MTEPKSVRIGPFDYEIRWMDFTDEQAHGRFGVHHSDSQTICLTRARKRQRIATTFWHEVSHAINHVYGPEGKDGMVNEEDLTGAIGYGIVAFIRDNQTTMAWFIDLATREPDAQYQKGNT